MNPQIQAVDFNQRPFIAIWEVTQACDLACVHCRASAQPERDPAELSTAEGKQLIDQIAAWKVPVFVLTGGDPIKRPDLFELIEYARTAGVRVSLTPSATPLLTQDVVHRLKHAGLARLAVSLDGASAPTHDAFRGMSGSFARTLNAVQWANEAGLPVQINTTFSRRNIGEIDEIVSLMEQLRITLWSVFFLVPTGRGKLDDLLSADEFESVFERLHQLSKTASFDIKTTEAQHYRRLVLQKRVAERREGIASVQVNVSPDVIGRAPRGLNDGKGFVFISHKGDVFPSGFLPLAGGNIRQEKLETIYCESPLFRGMRDTTMLEGKCGKCEFKEICGGSRSRSYALTGNPYAQEPCCSYIPRGYSPEQHRQPSPARLHVLQGA
jgi:AdoMet-dependent heme synthase